MPVLPINRVTVALEGRAHQEWKPGRSDASGRHSESIESADRRTQREVSQSSRGHEHSGSRDRNQTAGRPGRSR